MSDEQSQEVPEDPNEENRSRMAQDVLSIAQEVYGFLSPMQHLMALSFAMAQIAYAIEVEANNIVSANEVQSFMNAAAEKSGLAQPPISATHPVIFWNIDEHPTVPNCVICTDKPLELDQVYEEIAYGHCPGCKTRHQINLTGGKLSNE